MAGRGKDLFDVSGRVAIVTGASSGLGVTFARALGERGAKVVLAARRKERLDELARSMKKSGAEALAVRCDIADEAQVGDMTRQALERFGKIDILVNNAGSVTEESPYAERVTNKGFDDTVRANLNGTWYCINAVAPHMLGRGSGAIVNISSIGGLGGLLPIGPAYQAAKAAVNNLTRNLALNWGDRGVRVNALAPGYFPSELSDGFVKLPGMTKRVTRMAPLGRIGDPEELVGPLLLLVSDAGSFITGQVLTVDGGLSAGVGYVPLDDAGHDVFLRRLDAPFGERIPSKQGRSAGRKRASK
ncbi:MAG: glucose 1-dehydrogenase [SAR202 cluster bacterium]|nr:glucose 1-dehydrogenase [SAR202 cluster bacterium]